MAQFDFDSYIAAGWEWAGGPGAPPDTKMLTRFVGAGIAGVLQSNAAPGAVAVVLTIHRFDVNATQAEEYLFAAFPSPERVEAFAAERIATMKTYLDSIPFPAPSLDEDDITGDDVAVN